MYRVHKPILLVCLLSISCKTIPVTKTNQTLWYSKTQALTTLKKLYKDRIAISLDAYVKGKIASKHFAYNTDIRINSYKDARVKLFDTLFGSQLFLITLYNDRITIKNHLSSKRSIINYNDNTVTEVLGREIPIKILLDIFLQVLPEQIFSQTSVFNQAKQSLSFKKTSYNVSMQFSNGRLNHYLLINQKTDDQIHIMIHDYLSIQNSFYPRRVVITFNHGKDHLDIHFSVK